MLHFKPKPFLGKFSSCSKFTTHQLNLIAFKRHYGTKPKLPVISFSNLSFPLQTSSQVQQIAQQVRDAFSTFGFFYLIGHGIPTNVEKELVSFSRKFFDLPLDMKMPIHLTKGGIAWRGYMPLEGERTHGRPDRKEGLYVAPEHPSDHPKVIAGTPSFGKNQFPDASMPGLRPAALTYLNEVTQVGHNLMEVLSVSLGLPPSYIHQHLTHDPVILFRLWNYPPQKNPPLVQPIGIDDHTDYGLVTLLKQELPGLQFKHPVHGWIDVLPVDGALVCSAGDLLDRITAGRYKSRPHRVVLDHIDQSNKPRLSFPCFFDPGWDAYIKELPLDHLPPLVDGENPEERWKNTAYKTLTGQYWQYLAKKLSKVFPQLSDYEFEGARASSTRFHIQLPK